jgi:hypothetical protein
MHCIIFYPSFPRAITHPYYIAIPLIIPATHKLGSLHPTIDILSAQNLHTWQLYQTQLDPCNMANAPTNSIHPQFINVNIKLLLSYYTQYSNSCIKPNHNPFSFTEHTKVHLPSMQSLSKAMAWLGYHFLDILIK